MYSTLHVTESNLKKRIDKAIQDHLSTGTYLAGYSFHASLPLLPQSISFTKGYANNTVFDAGRLFFDQRQTCFFVRNSYPVLWVNLEQVLGLENAKQPSKASSYAYSLRRYVACLEEMKHIKRVICYVYKDPRIKRNTLISAEALLTYKDDLFHYAMNIASPISKHNSQEKATELFMDFLKKALGVVSLRYGNLPVTAEEKFDLRSAITHGDSMLAYARSGDFSSDRLDDISPRTALTPLAG